MVNKTQHRKLKIEQHEIHYKLGGGEHGCCVMVSNSCSISDTRHVAHTTNPTICHERNLIIRQMKHISVVIRHTFRSD